MKKLVLAMFALASAASFAADVPASCQEYFKTAEETFKKEGNDVEAALKVVKDQVAAVGEKEQDAFCKAATEALKTPVSDAKEDAEDAKEEAEEAKEEAKEAKEEAKEAKEEAKEEAKADAKAAAPAASASATPAAKK